MYEYALKIYGAQYLAKLPPLLNAREYMSMMDETRYNEASPLHDWAGLLPTDLYNSINFKSISPEEFPSFN